MPTAARTTETLADRKLSKKIISEVLSRTAVVLSLLQQVLTATLSAGRSTPEFYWYWQQRKFFTEDFRQFL